MKEISLRGFIAVLSDARWGASQTRVRPPPPTCEQAHRTGWPGGEARRPFCSEGGLGVNTWEREVSQKIETAWYLYLSQDIIIHV